MKLGDAESFTLGVYADLKARGLAKRVGFDSAQFLTAVMEYLLAELLDMAADVCVAKSGLVITPVCIRKAIDQDHEFSILLRNTSIRFTNIKARRSSISPNSTPINL
jgi:hypothetical protein